MTAFPRRTILPSAQQQEIVALCRELGIGQCGLGSIRNFIAAAFFHVGLPGTLPADEHVAFNSAIRFATNRIACQGAYGASIGMSRLLSRRAFDLRERILADTSVPDREKLGRWRGQVTEEHWEPVAAVTTWIAKTQPTPTIDDVVLRLLTHPSVVVTREEDAAIRRSGYRDRGAPEERYRAADIEVLLVDEGTFDRYRGSSAPGRKPRPRKYDASFVPFDCDPEPVDQPHAARPRRWTRVITPECPPSAR